MTSLEKRHEELDEDSVEDDDDDDVTPTSSPTPVIETGDDKSTQKCEFKLFVFIRFCV